MKKSKQKYITKYFESNIKNLKTTQKGIKSIISLKSSTSILPDLLNFGNRTISDPFKIVNFFNNYFSSVGEKTQSKIRFSGKTYTDYLHGENFNHNSFLLQLQTVKKLCPLYPQTMITNFLVQIVHRQEY